MRFHLHLAHAVRHAAACLALGAAVWARAASAATDADCQKCHADSHLSAEKDGKQVSLFVDATQITASAHDKLHCVECHVGVDAQAKPHHESAAAVDCRSCHESIAKSHAFHLDFAAVPFVPTAETECTDCHGSHAMGAASGPKSAFAGPKLAASCADCHEEDVARFRKSAHGLALEAGRTEAPNCLTCHSRPIAGGSNKLHMKTEQARLCLSCHRDNSKVVAGSTVSRNFIASYAESVHGRALSHGKAAAANCVDCHGSHDTMGALSSASRENLQNIPATCARCHQDQAKEYAKGAHAAALRKGSRDAPVCTTCHGEHGIAKHGDPDAAVYERNVSERVCGSCHASVKLAERYGLASDRFATFADSYHGLSTRGGSTVAVNCASCHGVHTILPSSDPASPVAKANLIHTCGQCHPKADARFTAAPVHVTLSAAGKEALVYWISTLYLWLIVAVVGAMVVHNGLDFFRKIRRKIAIQKGEIVEEAIPHRLYLRMTVGERLQHATLVGSFSVLVVTGFMLKFPDAWWVVSIRQQFGHVFELRSLLHRVAGVVMVLAGVWHVLYLWLTPRGRGLFFDLLPRPKDLHDAVGVLRYNLGLAPEKPRFGRFSYIEKTEYWAMMWGSIVMGLTGALLWFENTSIGLVTRLGFDVSRTVHLYEAVLATLAIIVWHFYFVIFNPDIYPMNLSWLTGWLSEKEMREDHPLELERIEAERARQPETPQPKPPCTPQPPLSAP